MPPQCPKCGSYSCQIRHGQVLVRCDLSCGDSVLRARNESNIDKILFDGIGIDSLTINYDDGSSTTFSKEVTP
jgi:hypothetical protein